MNVVQQFEIQGPLLLKHELYSDDRGYFFEAWNHREFTRVTGETVSWCQDNVSSSHGGVLRGLHYQIERPQGKLVRCLHGEIYDVVVDLRKSSKTFGWWVGMYLSAKKHVSLWVPPGFAHGFYVTSREAEVSYKVTDFRVPSAERTLLWDDPFLQIKWPIKNVPPILSDKDQAGHTFYKCEAFS